MDRWKNSIKRKAQKEEKNLNKIKHKTITIKVTGFSH